MLSDKTNTAMQASTVQLVPLGVFQAVSDAVIVADDQNRVVWYNRAAEALYGIDGTQAVGKLLDEIIRVQDDALALETIQAESAAAGSWQGNAVHMGPQDQRIQVEWTVSATFPDGSSRVGTWISIARDTTKRHQAESLHITIRDLALKISAISDLDEALRMLLGTAIESSEMDGGAVYLVEPNGGARMRVHQGLPDELVSTFRVLPPESPYAKSIIAGKQLFADAAYLAKRTTKSTQIEIDAQVKSSVIIPVLHQGRTVASMHLVSRQREEISEMARTAVLAISNQLASAIARLVSEKEKVSLQEQLLQARKMESMGRLAGSIAHDFNNLLTVVIGNLDIALNLTHANAPLRDTLKEIKKASKSAVSLTRQLLAFSRKQVIQPKTVSLGDVVHRMHGMLGRLIGEDVRLRLILRSCEWAVRVDPVQMEQIILNLAVNARDAMAAGGTLTIEISEETLGETSLRRHPLAKPGDYVMLAVRDTGHGMSQEVQKHLFEPFFTTKPSGKGTGLGLATVYGAVQQNEGFIDVDSTEGVGTTVRIHFPRFDGPLDDSTGSDRRIQVFGGTETIMLVEDEVLVHDLVVRLLRLLGYSVLPYSNGEDALRAIDEFEGQIHLLMTDVVMPRMDGFALVKKALEKRPGMKVLYTSGYSGQTVHGYGIHEQDVNFLPKPYSADVLASKLREVLDPAPVSSSKSGA